jgi:hypothetical protein
MDEGPAMSSKIKMWEISKEDKPVEIDTERFGKVNLEDRLESWIEKNPSILGEKLLIIRRQYVLPNGEKADLLAVDQDGNLCIIELKKDKTTREVIAQVLNYETLLSNLKEEGLDGIASTYFEEKGLKWENLREAFEEEFGKEGVSFNGSRRTFIIAPQLDETTESTIDYLSSQYKIDMNGITFTYYKDGAGRESVIRNVVVSDEERRQRTTYNLDYHLERAKNKDSRMLLEAIAEYFRNKGFRLHPTKYYISMFLGDTEIGHIKPRKTLAHITLNCDIYEPKEVSRLVELSKKDTHFEVKIDEEWRTKDDGDIISVVRLKGLDLATFKKYETEIDKLKDSFVSYLEHHEELDEQGKRIGG